MASNIDESIPVDGTDIDADPIRANFAAAKAEIEALQASGEPVSVPASPSATGTPGQWAWGSPYLYWCVETDTWVRVVPARSWT